MKKERYYYSTDLSISSLEVVTTNSGEIIGTSDQVTPIRKIPRITVCGILDTDTNTMSFGVSRCASKDTFVKTVGRSYAKERAEQKPYKVVSVGKDKISDVFMDNAQLIEQEVLAMVYPIKL